MRIGETIKAGKDYLTKALPLYKWKRPDGLSSFLADMIALRKALCLCYSCEHTKMPRNWLSRCNYALVKSFHAEENGCDYCRQVTSTNLYIAVEGKYYQDMTLAEKSVRETQERDRRTAERDRMMMYTY